MDAVDKTFSELVSIVKTWIPWRSEPANVCRDFWMPDESCRVCYECDSQFNLFNRKHHCRLCGRIFCNKCTTNSVPAPVCIIVGKDSCTTNKSASNKLELEKIRVCNYCYKQWEQGVVAFDNSVPVSNLDNSASASTSSSNSSKTSATANSSNITLCSMPYSVGSYQQTQQGSVLNLHKSPVKGKDTDTDREGLSALGGRSDLVADLGDSLPKQCGFAINRTDDDEDEYGVYRSDSDTRHYSQVNNYYGQAEFDRIGLIDGSRKVDNDVENIDAKLPSNYSFDTDTQGLEGAPIIAKNEDEPDICDENEAPSSLYVSEDVDVEPVDFENNGLLWLPPEPEDEEDEHEAILFDDDDDDDGNVIGEWGYIRSSSSFGSGDYRQRDRSNEEQKKVMKNVVDGHFRALVAQLLQVENLSVEDNDENSWLEIVTSLSWEAATILKPDMSKGGVMDPAGYVKVKCIACGNRNESVLVKGVVCKKNVAHRRMSSKVDKPRLLILGGALEYQRVTNLFSSVDTLLQQEMDHLKMAVAKIASHQPNMLLVEKSVSRYAQEYLLAKDITLVLNVKRPLLERVARCTGTQIVPSIDHLSSQKLGYCESVHVEKFLEDLNCVGQCGKKTVKTLMFFEGCPKPFGFTILLKGADKDELKKVKHVVQYGVFAAYHLAMETSFLADEGASLPEIPLNSLALPDQALAIQRSISTVPGFGIADNEKPQGHEPDTGPRRTKSVPISELASTTCPGPCVSNGASQLMPLGSSLDHSTAFFSSIVASGNSIAESHCDKLPPCTRRDRNEMNLKQPAVKETSMVDDTLVIVDDPTAVDPGTSKKLYQGLSTNTPQNGDSKISTNQLSGSGSLSPKDGPNHPENLEIPNEEFILEKEEFPPSPSDHQSILVSLSSRCVWKGTVCERSHLFRIRYYGNFDKPLGRYLRDHLFDQSYRCHSCQMPSEAHVHCYTHRQGTLTISVKKLPEIILPGERDGKIWMWHRCLRCPRINGFPPATQRIVMSDAAWGLSLGKFLELSFSNHAAASRVASCGHSLHRDCLRFYGFGKMVACFRYASIDVHSVYLPPHTLIFDYGNQDWIQRESDEVVNRAELLFSEVLNGLSQIGEQRSNAVQISNGHKTPEVRRQVAELEGMLQKEKLEFEEALRKILNQEKRNGQPGIDILEINRLWRQLLFQSYMWDHRLIYAANSVNSNNVSGSSSPISEDKEKTVDENQMTINSVHDGPNLNENSCLGGGSAVVDGKISPDLESEMTEKENHEKDERSISIRKSINDQSDPLESELGVRRTLSDGPIPIVPSLSETLDAKWTGENHSGFGIPKDNSSVNPDLADTSMIGVQKETYHLGDRAEDQNGSKSFYSSFKGHDNMEDSSSWLGMPFLNFYRQFNKNLFASTQKFDTLVDYNPVFVSSFRKQELQGGARLLLPIGVNDTVIPVYDDEPSSIIAYALMSSEYHLQLTDEGERPREGSEFTSSYLSDSGTFLSFSSVDETAFDSQKSFGSIEDMILSMSGSRSSSMFDPMLYTKAMHARVSFGEDGPLGKVKYSVTCYYAKRFEALRRVSCPSELDYIRSLSRCKKWGAQGGKSNVFFAKTLDDRFIIKQVTKTELESFIKFGPEYFKYLSESIATGSPTCLAKILGIYQVTSKHVKGGKESRMDVLVMENLLYRRTVTRLYDLKGSSRSRYNADSTGKNKVLLDQNLIEAMPTSPIFVGNKAKRSLERAVWNDTGFLASVDVMDYSLLVGVDEEKHELVIGIIDFMRQYTWDKHLETWVKASGILGGPKNTPPTVISPKQYKKRFRKAMTTYFLMLPDQWSPPSIVASNSQSDLGEDNPQSRTSAE
ncbi:1-phosphatidylinositol-3-phosphate 5-kinase FAB1B [Vigna radiata var. radiata]|uniref:1-phosphatidylinositol-3-phosphate 5-kinase n=1 Tax=Vigna radiata var. radiata TaxID=3916 RepID=A0A3Q0ENJ9_VIGRR|nr:1-phosphatidylinositol-3-phosphate 5-kinase FAB1B [Vigna radiata var. radiata]XP_022631798.1 1-phosphatidylinositol-3-phosphate 5-kinase FAB1B [Vigna radiata var. radiata]